jgi:imidazolonepropionase-like amidohydrolase
VATRTLILNAHILTQNDAREVYKRGSVLIEEGRNARLDNRADVQESGAEIIDAEGMALLPGLVNAHSHIMCILLRRSTPHGLAVECDGAGPGLLHPR